MIGMNNSEGLKEAAEHKITASFDPDNFFEKDRKVLTDKR